MASCSVFKWMAGSFELRTTIRKVSAKPPYKAPILKDTFGALRYTFELTDVAVRFVIGDKVSTFFFYLFIFKM